MNLVPSFSLAQVQALAHLLGECGSGTQITAALKSRGLEDKSGESTKWRRLFWVFQESQKQYGCANPVMGFIQSFLGPAGYLGQSTVFNIQREQLNAILSFSGIEFGADGQFHPCATAHTLAEAERRLNTIHAKLQGRRTHAEVLKYCRAELLQDNYFHAVFEAVKGLAQRIRDMSGFDAEGAALIDGVFLVVQPLLAVNTLQTELERSEQKGFAALLKGCFAAVRNPLAHEPKILWEGEDDAADYLTLISLLHRKLDDCVPTRSGRTT